jgi:predicted anti-sigma-YlaC factor YlaD
MNEHVNQLIGAYLDGELGQDRRAQIEAHLESCQACQQELRAARRLSTWLQADWLPQDLPSAEEFAARLAPRLPGIAPAAPRWSTPEPVWWLIPLVILGSWLAVQIAILLSGWGWALAPLGFSNAVLAWLAPDIFMSLGIDLATESLQPALGVIFPTWLVEYASLWGTSLVLLGLDAIAALLFMSWLAGLAARRIHLAHSPVPTSQAYIERKV